MDSAPRLELFGYDTLPDNFDEELPPYEPRSAPEYDSEESVPLYTFQLLQVDRKLQLLIPVTCTDMHAYQVKTHHTRPFSKKPHIELCRTVAGQMRPTIVASMRLLDDGRLPWLPRANFLYELRNYAMESRAGRAEDWKLSIENTSYTWRGVGTPVKMLEMNETGSKSVIARFTYSRRGTFATNGEAVGELIIYRHGLSVERAGVEKMICALAIAMHYPRQELGRHFRNDAP